MPIMPPNRQTRTASIRNCCMMSLLARADRHADADLAGPLGHRHQHDVHDADAADDQRDNGNGRDHQLSGWWWSC